VHDIAYLGGHSVFYIKLPSGMLVQSFMANCRTPRHPAYLGRRSLRVLGKRQWRGAALMKTPILKRLVPKGRNFVIGVPFLWLFMFFLLPFFIVMKISFAEAEVAIPPYSELTSYVDQQFTLLLNLGNYVMLANDSLYVAAYLGSLEMAFFSTLLCLLIGYPMAYAIARAPKEMHPQHPAADHDAVLDLVPDPGLCLDGHPQQQRLLNNGFLMCSA
jgi:hypothetical protein